MCLYPNFVLGIFSSSMFVGSTSKNCRRVQFWKASPLCEWHKGASLCGWQGQGMARSVCCWGGETHSATGPLPSSHVLLLPAVRNDRCGCLCYLYNRNLLNPQNRDEYLTFLCAGTWQKLNDSLGSCLWAQLKPQPSWWESFGGSQRVMDQMFRLSQSQMQKRAYSCFVQHIVMCWDWRMCWSPPKFLGSTKAARQLLKC